MTDRKSLLIALDTLLEPARFKDYGPNGLQVEGKAEVRKIVSGVTASFELIEAAAAAGADAILVHHGLFWRGQDGSITGWMRRRLQLLLSRNINLYAYHLPLDAHPQFGNNVQWGNRMGMSIQSRFGDQSLGCLGVWTGGAFRDADALVAHVSHVLGRPVMVYGGVNKSLERIAWCSGGAQSYFEEAIAAGADAFLTGEVSEPQYHYARECGVPFLCCGHHASERYGVQAVASQVAAQLGLEHEFIDIDNPV